MMAQFDLTQAEADVLIGMEKHRANEERTNFPMLGESVSLPLRSTDGREQFLLDLYCGRINLHKVTMQNRGRQIVVLVRLDLDGPPHRNPDGEEIGTPHLHIYREGYGDKWAFPVRGDEFRDLGSAWTTYEDFLQYCNVTRAPHIQGGLFI